MEVPLMQESNDNHNHFRIPCIEGIGGLKIPHIGIGTYELRGDTCKRAVSAAIQMGFRLLDTAAGYHNEELVGAAIRESGVPRGELFIVVKIAPKSMVSDTKVEESIRDSIRKLCIGYADTVLIHWPGCGGLKPHEAEGHKAARQRSWKIMSQLQSEGLLRHLGVSNFAPRHFEGLMTSDNGISLFDVANVSRPMMNQIELHPLCIQEEVCNFCRAQGVILQQYSPLAQGNKELIEHPVLCAIVKDMFPGRSVYDVLLMWGLAQGFCVLVRSGSEEHLAENFAAAKAFFSPGVLSEKQKEHLYQLRDLMHIKEDKHFCWFSETID